MRKKPYTQMGVKRKKCFRCKNKAVHQWQICSDHNQYRTICLDCDIELNKMVLVWMGFPDWEEKITSYENFQRGRHDNNNVRLQSRRKQQFQSA